MSIDVLTCGVWRTCRPTTLGGGAASRVPASPTATAAGRGLTHAGRRLPTRPTPSCRLFVGRRYDATNVASFCDERRLVRLTVRDQLVLGVEVVYPLVAVTRVADVSRLSGLELPD